MADKVKLPREVAEALEKLGKIFPKDFILWHSSREDYPDAERDAWKTINEFVDIPDAIFTLADALRYGYVIDEPITVEITTEMQEMIQQYIGSIRQDRENVDFAQGEEMGLMTALSIFNIKIPGVNE